MAFGKYSRLFGGVLHGSELPVTRVITALESRTSASWLSRQLSMAQSWRVEPAWRRTSTWLYPSAAWLSSVWLWAHATNSSTLEISAGICLSLTVVMMMREFLSVRCSWIECLKVNQKKEIRGHWDCLKKCSVAIMLEEKGEIVTASKATAAWERKFEYYLEQLISGICKWKKDICKETSQLQGKIRRSPITFDSWITQRSQDAPERLVPGTEKKTKQYLSIPAITANSSNLLFSLVSRMSET